MPRRCEQLLAQLRAAAARAEAERSGRRGTRARATRSRQAAATSRKPRRRAPVVASAAPLQVGGLGWPLSGTLLAGYGGTLPDGRSSQGC